MKDLLTEIAEGAVSQEGRRCRTCRWWSMHSLDLNAGDCMAPSSAIGPHRYGRVRMPDGTLAMWDSFGCETTPPDYTCGAWDDGALGPPNPVSHEGEA